MQHRDSEAEESSASDAVDDLLEPEPEAPKPKKKQQKPNGTKASTKGEFISFA